jgi:hypothetical protein
MNNIGNEKGRYYPWCSRCPIAGECESRDWDNIPYTKLSFCVGACFYYTATRAYRGAFKDCPLFLQREVDIATKNILACRESLKNIGYALLEDIPATRGPKND